MNCVTHHSLVQLVIAYLVKHWGHFFLLHLAQLPRTLALRLCVQLKLPDFCSVEAYLNSQLSDVVTVTLRWRDFFCHSSHLRMPDITDLCLDVDWKERVCALLLFTAYSFDYPYIYNVIQIK